MKFEFPKIIVDKDKLIQHKDVSKNFSNDLILYNPFLFVCANDFLNIFTLSGHKKFQF